MRFRRTGNGIFAEDSPGERFVRRGFLRWWGRGGTYGGKVHGKVPRGLSAGTYREKDHKKVPRELWQGTYRKKVHEKVPGRMSAGTY